MSAAFAVQVEVDSGSAIPPDPEDLDATRPSDLDLCVECQGEGAIQVQTGDPYPGAWDGEECPFCNGTGQRGAA